MALFAVAIRRASVCFRPSSSRAVAIALWCSQSRLGGGAPAVNGGRTSVRGRRDLATSPRFPAPFSVVVRLLRGGCGFPSCLQPLAFPAS